MRVIKATDLPSNVIPLPVRYVDRAEPLLIDRDAEANRWQLEANRLRRRRIVRVVLACLAALVLGAFIGWCAS